MLTKLEIRRFKRFADVSVELASPVVLIGPNDSGKTTTLQALALWDIGLRRWNEKRAGKKTPERRPGVTINRRDLLSVPVPDAIFLWQGLSVRSQLRDIDGKQATQNIRMEILVEGVSGAETWRCGLEFDYANQESFYCRPLRLSENGTDRMSVPAAAGATKIAFLPPMSGLAATEDRLDPGSINVRLGEGRTSEVLRNLCWGLQSEPARWAPIVERMKQLFGVTMDDPVYIPDRGEITMTYRTPSNVQLDIASAGRGMQQTLLLLAHLAANPRSVLLLDEPDAHLEILRQRQIYKLLTDTAREHQSQIIAASHSEVVLNEAADRDLVVAFVGKPHRIGDRGSQVLKSLKEIGFESYYQAELTGWVLYLEGATDLAILQAFATRLEHPAAAVLARPFVHYVQNQPTAARNHFYGLAEAKPDLRGFALFDHLNSPLQAPAHLAERMWSRNEIENYLCQPETLRAYAESSAHETTEGPLFASAEAQRRLDAMNEAIADLVPPVALRDPRDSWWVTTKASTEFLDRLFVEYFKRLSLPNTLSKSNYHVLAAHVPAELLDPEVGRMLDALAEAASDATASPADPD